MLVIIWKRTENKTKSKVYIAFYSCVTIFWRPYAVTVPLCLYKALLELRYQILGMVARLTMKQYSYREHLNKSGLFRFVKKSSGIWNTEGTTSGVGNPSAVNYWSLLQGEGYHPARSALKPLEHLLLGTGLDGAWIWPSTAILTITWLNNLN